MVGDGGCSVHLLPSSLLQLASLAATAAVCWVIGWVAYHVFVHPLSSYPGPKLWAVTRIPFAYWNIRGRLPFKVHELHQQYGPVVRLAPDYLSFIEPEAWNDIYGFQPGRIQNHRDPYAYTPRIAGDEQSIIHASDAFHPRLRKMYGAAFTPKALEEQSGMLLKYANLLVVQLKKACKQSPVQDMSAWYNFTTFDLTGEFAFGEAFHCLERGGEEHFFVKTVMNGVVAGMQMGQLNYWGVLTLLKPLIPKSAWKPKEDMDNYSKALVDKRLERGYDPTTIDLFNYLLQQKDEEGELSRESLYENGISLVVAGSETTATLLAGVTYFLCKHSDLLRKVQDEVRSRFKTEAKITPRTVNDLTYMIAVLTEALRVFPPSAFLFTRILSSKGGQQVAGHYVPYGTRVATCHMAVYRSNTNFARPDDFVPERWLSAPPQEFKNDRRDALQPFMVGPRGCIGKGLALAEMRIILAKMLWHFDLELAESGHDWYGSLRAFMVWERKPLNVRLTPVKR